MACQGFLVYAIGFITPYLERDLGAAPWLAAVPVSAMAIGLLAGGAIAPRLNARLGARVGIRAWAGGMAVAAILLAVPISIVVILAGAFLFGLSIGGGLVHVNSALGPGPLGPVRLVRANMYATIGGLVAPIAMSAAARTVGWSLGSLIPVPFLVLLVATLPASPARDERSDRDTAAPAALPREYWLAWSFLTLTIAAEFSFVAWASAVVQARAGLGTADATGLASLYVAGMVVGRFVLGTNRRLAARRLPVLRVGTAMVAIGALVVAGASDPLTAGIGLLLGGLGLAPAYPLGASLALAHAPRVPVAASARLTAASGVAIATAPLGLGIVAGVLGVGTAWLLVVAVLGLALLLTFGIPAPREEALAVPGTVP
jgi:fucose permease